MALVVDFILKTFWTSELNPPEPISMCQTHWALLRQGVQHWQLTGDPEPNPKNLKHRNPNHALPLTVRRKRKGGCRRESSCAARRLAMDSNIRKFGGSRDDDVHSALHSGRARSAEATSTAENGSVARLAVLNPKPET